MVKLSNIPRRVATTMWSGAGQRTGVKGFQALDGLRGYMAWWVVIGHALHLCGLQNVAPNFLSMGHHAVNIFVCLSGFVITHLILERQESYGPYLIRRAFRIFPIYWFALICAIVLAQAYTFVYSGDWVYEREMRAARTLATESNLGTHLLLHIGLLHGLVPDNLLPFSSTAFLGPAWSLSLEWQFYVVAPFLVAALAKPGLTRLIAVLLLCAAWVVFKKIVPWHWQYPAALPLAIHFFMLGILSRVFLPAMAKLGGWLLAAGLVATLVAPAAVRTEVVIWSIFMTSVGFQLRGAQDSAMERMGGGKALSALTSNKAACWLGTFSYSTYLIHIPLFSLAGWLAALLVGEWTQSVAIWSTLLSAGLLVPLSLFLYRHIEQRFIRMGASLAQPSRGAVGAA